jgi:hypothetical protein
LSAPKPTLRVAQVHDDRFKIEFGAFCIDAPSVSPASAVQVAVFSLAGVRLK